MANWKKIIVSGSNAELQSLLLDSLVQVSDNQIISSSAADTKLSGSFSGSFAGDGSGLTGLTADSIDFSNIQNLPTLVSSSAQFDDLNAPFTGSFTGSFTGDGSGLTGLVTELRISGSTGNDTIDLLTDSLTFLGGTGVTAAVSNNTVTYTVQDATTAVKGIASFNSDSFTVSGGAVSLANSTSGAVLAISGTTNEIEVSRANGTVTVGLPDNVTITQGITAATGSISGNFTVDGDLVVNGTVTTINTTNLEVSDRFILLNSGSAQSATPKGGIIIDSGTGAGNTFLYNNTQNRWGFKASVSSTSQTGETSEAFAAAVITGEAGQFSGKYDQIGNIRVNGDDIFIWT